MDKIYSRKKIKLPKIEGFNFRSNKATKVTKVITVFVIAFITAYVIIKNLNPMFNLLCTERAKGIATEILNRESSKVLEDVKYEDLVNIVKDSNENIKLININTIKINLLASSIAYNINQELYKTENSKIKLPIGGFSGSKYFAGIGPRLEVNIYPVGNVITNLKSEFSSAGINQTIHKIYLEATCNISIVTPYDKIETSILNQILMTEAIIVGEIPDAYYNLEGIDHSNLLDIIN